MLSVENATRRYGQLVAVDDVSFVVPAGELVGFVGANGAGKTTVMRMVLGVLGMHGGTVRWDEEPVTAQQRRRFGYMPEERGLYPKQQVRDQLAYLGRLAGLGRRTARGRADDLLDRLGLGDRLTDVLESLSLGNQQRVQVAASLMNDPVALVLDEPFSGLDPVATDAMTDLLRDRAAAGVPILFSSHQLDLVERLCDRLVVLDHGRVVVSGTPQDLRDQGDVRHRIRLGGDAGWLRDARGVDVLDVNGADAIVTLTGWTTDDLLRAATERGRVLELVELRPSLADIYREVTVDDEAA